MARTNHTRLALWLQAALAGVLLLIAVPTAVTAQSIEEPAAATDEPVAVEKIALHVATSGSVTTASLVATWGPVLRDVQDTLDTITGHTPADQMLVTFVGSLPDDPRWTDVEPVAAISARGNAAMVLLDPFVALSETDQRNVFRSLAARHWLFSASGGAMPTPLLDGFAHYLEEPVLARQARQASLAQQAWLDGDLPAWDRIMADPEAMRSLDPDAASAARLATAAFLIERYGANMVADVASAFAAEPDRGVAAIIGDLTGQPRDRLDAAWDDFITTWLASGWRTNAFATLDLAPAEDLLARGAYEAAVDRANQTLQVTAALDDRIASAEAEMIVAQGSVGMQAEALMRDAEEALRSHEYDRTLTLLDRAVDQYALLPEDHRPDSLIETWRGLATDGTTAIEELQGALAVQNDWFSMREARSEAVSAGETFARLGDAERLGVAQEVVGELDARFLRLVFALGAAIVVLVAWLLIWNWNRAPGRVRWPGLADLAQEGGAR